MARGSHWPSAGSSEPLSGSTMFSTESSPFYRARCNTSAIHRPLATHVHLPQGVDPWKAQQQCHLAAISKYTTSISHIAGEDLVADTQSQTIMNAVHKLEPGVDFTTMTKAQRADKEKAAYCTSIFGLVLQVQIGPTDMTFLCDYFTSLPQPIIPATLCWTVFDLIYDLSQPTIQATQKLLTDRYVWHGIQAGQEPANCTKRPRFRARQGADANFPFATMAIQPYQHRHCRSTNITRLYSPAHDRWSVYEMARSDFSETDRYGNTL